MKTFPTVAALIIGAFLIPSIETAQAREPFMGGYRGSCDRKVDRAKPKKRKLESTATVVQNGATNYDTRTTITATGNGEKLEIVLDLDALNNGKLTINGTVVAGPGARDREAQAKTKKLKIRLSATGTATFVGPIRQTLALSGNASGIPFTVTGVTDLDSSGGLILNLDIVFQKVGSLGKKASFAFLGART
jgi:hypothetical protein